MTYSMSDIYNSLTSEKRKADGSMTAFVFRPISYPVSWLFLRLGVSPNGVTYVSMLFCVIAFILTLFPVVVFHWLAIAFFFVFAVLDCADGNMARTIGKKTVYGGFVDAMGGYLAYSTQLFSVGLSCYLLADDSFMGVALPWDTATWVLLGGFAACGNSLMRLFFQAMKNAEITAGVIRTPGKDKRFSEEIGVTGYLPVLYAIGFATQTLSFVLVAYTFVYAGGLLLTTFKLIRRVSTSRQAV